MIKRIFRSPTYCTSDPEDRSVTADQSTSKIGGAKRLTEWGTHFTLQGPDKDLVLHVIHQIQDDLDGGQDNSRIGMRQSDRNTFSQLLSVHRRGWYEGEQGFEDIDLTPPRSQRLVFSAWSLTRPTLSILQELQ